MATGVNDRVSKLLEIYIPSSGKEMNPLLLPPPWGLSKEDLLVGSGMSGVWVQLCEAICPRIGTPFN